MSCPYSKRKHSQLGVEDTTRPQEDKLHFEGGKTDHLSDCSAMRFSDIKVTKVSIWTIFQSWFSEDNPSVSRGNAENEEGRKTA